ncbi:hypothetical protein GCM10007916_29580 [Psychromonas marina]|uniref:Uncharacterized protein n=1 Tax=Psychromonas marina TaxID=88364 RepID=A0ABQ6E3X4_9GAMM|nr:hypothetical protein [Psychromonas marina]GLS91888.1 hypothetical protein GCM10007916_29580 [Psychromonas marina]
MIIQPVISENSGQEGRWIAFLCVIIVSIGALLLPQNQAPHEHVSVDSHQISISDLSVQRLSMIADLRLAHEEVRALYDDTATWQSITQLAEDWLAPFVQDKSWEHQGRHHWLQIGNGIYQGRSEQSGGGYILNSQHREVDVWLDLNGEATSIEMKNAVLSAQDLVAAGWTQVVFSTKNDIHHRD